MNKLKRLWDRHKIKNNSTIYSQSEIREALHEVFDGVQIIGLDRKYRVPSVDAFQLILRQDVSDEIKYQSEYFDCDKFALLFRSLSSLHYRINAVGIAISYASAHAFNVVLIEHGNELVVYKLEPQSDELWRPEEPERERYTVKGETILI